LIRFVPTGGRRRPSSRLRTLSALVLAAFVLGACDRGPSPEEHRRAAREHAAAGELRAAVIELKNGLQKAPDDAAARWHLGELYLKLGFGAEAEKEVRRALELGRTGLQVKAGLARALVLQRRFQEAVDYLQELPDGEHGPLVAVRGLARLGLGEREAAERDFRLLLEAMPTHPDARLGIARLALADGRLDEAERHVDEALAATVDDSRLWNLKGRIRAAQEDFEGARAAFERSLDLNLFDVGARVGVARALLAAGKYEAVSEHTEALARLEPFRPIAFYLDALAARARDDLEGAEEALREVLKDAPDHAPSLLMLAAIDYLEGDFFQVLESLRRYRALAPDDLVAVKLAAATHMQLGNSKDAVTTLLPAAIEGSGDAQLLAMLGNAYARERDYSLATEFLQRAAAMAPRVADYRLQLAVTRLGTGESGEALGEIESAIEVDPEFASADIMRVLIYLQRGELDSALAAAREVAQKYPDNPMPVHLAAVALEARGERAEARKMYERAVEVDPAFTTAALNLARMDREEGNLEAARSRYEALLAKHENHANTLMALARLENEAGRPGAALELMERARAHNPQAFQPRIALAANYLRLGRIEDARAAAAEAVRLDSDHPGARWMLSRAELALGRPAEALESANALVELRPESAAAYFHRARVVERMGDLDRTRADLERTLALDPDHVMAQIALANMALATGRPGDALERAERLVAERPELAEALVLLARARLRTGDPGGAIEAAQALAEARPRSPLPHLLGGAAHRLRNDAAAARAAYEAALEVSPQDLDAQLKLAQLDAEAGELDAARRRYESIIADDPGQPQALVGLARLDAPQTEEQEDAAARIAIVEQARDENPSAVEPRLTLAASYLLGGRVDAALVEARAAARLAPGRADVLRVLSQAQLAAGRHRDALETAREFVDRYPERADARFQLALALDQAGDPAGMREALVQALEREPKHAMAALALARLELRGGRWTEAATAARRAQTARPTWAAGFEVEGDALMAQGKPTEAAEAYDHALARARDPRIVLKRARAQAQAGHRDEARRGLQSWLDEHPQDLRVREALADEYSRNDEHEAAIAEYRRLVELIPDHASALNKLAWLHYEREDTGAALDAARRAHEARPKDPAILDTLGWVLVESGDLANGRPLLEQAVARIDDLRSAADRATVRFHLASALYRAGAYDAAREQIDAALHSHEAFPEVEQARKLRRDIDLLGNLE